MAVASFPSSKFLISLPKTNSFSSSSVSFSPSSPKNCPNDSIGLNKRSFPVTASAAGGTATAESPRSTTTQYMSFSPTSCASTLYQDLGISMGASFQEIKSAYRKLAKTCHPDVASADQKDVSADDFMKIQAAYTTLSDPHKRMDYDRNLFKKSRSRSFSSSPIYATASGYTSAGNWETDQCW